MTSSRPPRPRSGSKDRLREPRARGPRSGGRPSRAEAEALGERILDVATKLFLSHGYGSTSIEAVARAAGISKRTFYHRFADKSELFGEAVQRIIERLRPPADVPLIEGADVRQILERLAGMILRAALSPQAVALHRLIVGESGRFPKVAAVVHRQGATQEAVRLIAGILAREVEARRIAVDDPTFAAEQFLYMVISVPQRRITGFGEPLAPAELDDWARKVVDLFLHGCRVAGGAAAVRSSGRSRLSVTRP
jgi:TetR/AcrR family transcriptional regulator, mexJK operon transcriptional repressor